MKLKNIIFVIIITLSITQFTFAQIHVDENGNVGIGTDTPASITKLDVESNTGTSLQKIINVDYTGTNKSNHMGIYCLVRPESDGYGYGGYFNGGYMGVVGYATGTYGSGYTGSSSRYGTYSKAKNGVYNYGLYTIATNGTYTGYPINRGIYTKAEGDGYQNTGIEAWATGNATNYAGKFYGNVYVSGTISESSDENLKEEIKDIEKSIDKIKELKPKKFKYKKDKKITLPDGDHYGLLAQDLEKVYPELVSDVINYEVNDPELDDSSEIEPSTTYKAVNYSELISILIKGMQDQQEMIESQQAVIDDLLKRVEKLEK